MRCAVAGSIVSGKEDGKIGNANANAVFSRSGKQGSREAGWVENGAGSRRSEYMFVACIERVGCALGCFLCRCPLLGLGVDLEREWLGLEGLGGGEEVEG